MKKILIYSNKIFSPWEKFLMITRKWAIFMSWWQQYSAILVDNKINIIGRTWFRPQLQLYLVLTQHILRVCRQKQNWYVDIFNQKICISSDIDSWASRRKGNLFEPGVVAGCPALCSLAHIDTYQLLKAAIHPYHPSTAPCDICCLTTTNPITFILS